MSVLAHVISSSKLLKDEPAATQALAFILNQETALVGAIARMLHIKFEPGQVVAEEADKGSRADLTIYDSEGKARILIENKFWGGLTDAQPILYIDKLPQEKESALVFIVPEKRMQTIWIELKYRCQGGGRKFQVNQEEGAVFLAKVTDNRNIPKTLMMTSWGYALSQLSEQTASMGNESIKRDILQLCGLTKKMDHDAFLPIRACEVSDQQIARRIVNYVDLIDEITKKLESKEIAEVLKPSGSPNGYYFGQYFILHKKFLFWLGLSFKYWKSWGKTPLWLTFDKSKNTCHWSNGKPDYKRIEKILKEPIIVKEGEYLCRPVLLKIASEQENVVRDAVSSIVEMAEKLKQEYYADQPLD